MLGPVVDYFTYQRSREGEEGKDSDSLHFETRFRKKKMDARKC